MADEDDRPGSSDAEEKAVIQLHRQLQAKVRQRALERYDRYYEGEQPLKYMAPALEAELGDRITQVVINWPRKGADTYENRLDIDGFRLSGQTEGDQEMWDWWLTQQGPAQSQEGNLEALILGRAAAIVGAGEDDDDPAVLTIEHPEDVTWRWDPKTRAVKDALKRWVDDDKQVWANLYLPDSTITFRKEGRGWVVDERDDHDLGECLLVPLLNRRRLKRQDGLSEFHDVIPIADAANKMATDMMISGEFHAMPRRWAMGFDEEDFEDEQGNPVSAWSMIAGRIWGTSKSRKDAQVGQFEESDLSVFHNTIKLLAALACEMLALPADYMRFVSDNPSSADAIRADEIELVKRVERKHTMLGSSYARVQYLRHLVEKGSKPDKPIEVVWRDPATPTVAQMADAAVKLNKDRILPLKFTRRRLGYTPSEIAEMEAEDEAQARRELAGLVAGIGPKPDDPDDA